MIPQPDRSVGTTTTQPLLSADWVRGRFVRRQFRTFVLLAGLSAAATSAWPNAQQAVLQRQEMMRKAADAAKRIAEMFDGRQRYSRTEAVSAADTIHSASGAALLSVFTGRIEGDKTQALPTINDKREEFVELADEMARLSSALSHASDGVRTRSRMPCE